MSQENDSIKELTEAQKLFCSEYVIDYNATRSYLIAYPKEKTENTAAVCASKLLRNANIQQFIKELQSDIGKLAGISPLKIANEYAKIAFSSIAHLHLTWIERKDFELLTQEQKDCIQEIDTKLKIEYQYNPESDKKEPISVEYIRVKLYDKKAALDSLNKMLGYNSPEKTELSNPDGTLNNLSHLTTEELIKRAEAIRTIEKPKNE